MGWDGKQRRYQRRLVQQLLEKFNNYAYTQIAIYGTGYREATRRTYVLLRRMGLVPLLSTV